MKEITADQLRLFFGRNADYYFIRWELYQEGRKITFKPWAFLFGIFWFLYRKMYFEALVIFLVTILEGALAQAFGADFTSQSSAQTANMVLLIVNSTVLGIFGNYLYIRHAERKIAGILQHNPIQTELEAELQQQGGTSLIVVLAGLVIFFIMVVLSGGV